jgi:hypothetical protein
VGSAILIGVEEGMGRSVIEVTEKRKGGEALSRVE